MASANTPLELNAEQREVASKLALAMKTVAPGGRQYSRWRFGAAERLGDGTAQYH